MTKQREIVYKIIMNSARHLTAEEVFLRAKEDAPSIAFGTVYRNLGIMVRDGDIGKLELEGEPIRYDKSCAPHAHLRCVKCGKIEDIVINEVQDILAKEVKGLVNYRLNINYVCEECNVSG